MHTVNRRGRLSEEHFHELWEVVLSLSRLSRPLQYLSRPWPRCGGCRKDLFRMLTPFVLLFAQAVRQEGLSEHMQQY